MKQIDFKSFTLKKVKTVKGGGLYAEYSTLEVSGNTDEGAVAYENEHKDTNTKFPHSDLTDLFAQLKPIVARVMNFSFYRELVTTDEFGATEEQSRYLERTYQEILAKIDVNGVSVSGKDSNAGCVIMATFLTEVNNNRTAINVPRIKFNTSKFGFEEELEDICQSIKEETFAFLFENKVGEPELFDNYQANQENDDPDLFSNENQEQEQNEPEQQVEESDLPDMTVSDQEKDDEVREQEAND